MKFLWIIWACSTMFNSINARRTEITIKLQRESNDSINTLDSISRGNNVSLDIKQNKLRDAVKHGEKDRKPAINHRLMPKIAIKHIYDLSYPKNSNDPTTRRPLMKTMKFTTKPHVIHYVHSRFEDEQSTLSKTKNSNIKIQFKPKTNKNNQNIPEDPDSVDNNFKTFIDIGDTETQRDNFFATAASEKVGSVTNLYKLNTEEFRSYSRRAFEESLENIRNIRSRKKTKTHSGQNNTDLALTQIKNNIIYIVVPSTIKNPAEMLTTSEKLALVTKFAEEPIDSAQLKENVFNVVNLTETINSYVNTTTYDDENTTLKTENIKKSLKNTDTSIIYSVEPTNESSDVETNTPVAHPDFVNKANSSSYTTESLGPEITTINTEKFSHLVTEKTDSSMHKTKKSLYHAEIVSTWPFRTADITAAVETSGKTILKTEKAVPLVVIVAGNSISLPESNEAISNEKIVDPNISMIKDEEKGIKGDNYNETPISVEDEASIAMARHLALRKKRRINVIEEEGVATTSNLFKFNERNGRFTVDCTFRNIHT